MLRYKGTVLFLKKNGHTFARGRYFDNEKDKNRDVWRKVTGKKSDAKDAVINEIEKRLNKPPEKVKEKTFLDLAEYYKTNHAIPARFVDDVKVAGKKTWRVMHHDIEQMEAFFGDLELKSLTRDKVQAFRLMMLDRPVRKVDKDKKEYFAQRSLASVNHYLRTLRAMLNVALSNDWIVKMPSFKELISASSENKREIIPTESEFDRILKATEKRQRLNHIKPIVLMIADAGARPVEIWNLKWPDLDLEAETVTLTSDKGRRRIKRKLGLTIRLKTELARLPRTNEYVFGGIRSIKTAWRSIQSLADVPHLTPYHFRHLFNSRLVAEGYSKEERLKLMGQTEFTTNLGYTHLLADRLEDVAKRLDANPYLPIQETETVQ